VSKPHRVLPAVLAAALMTAPLLVGAAVAESPVTAMHGVFDALQKLAPIAYGTTQDAWKKREKVVRESL